MPRRTMEHRFWRKVDWNGPISITHPDLGPCWIWKAGLADHGYGNFWDGKRNRKAHCVAYELHNGEIPSGLELDHLCGVRGCVNPAHLEAVTHAVNARRGDGGSNHAEKQFCRNGHPYSGHNLYLRPDGRRCCRTCRRQQAQAHAEAAASR